MLRRLTRPLRAPHAHATAFALTLTLAGCTPAGVFTSARPLARGVVNAYPFVDITGARLGARENDYHSPPTQADQRGFVPGVGVRVGVVRRVELGGRLALGLAEVSSVVNVVDQPIWALALAPRIQSGWGPPVLGRLPVLLTYDVTPWASVTPRVGVGYGMGRLNESAVVVDVRAPEYVLASGFLEAGCGLQFRVASFVGIALDAYYLRSVGNREVDAPGGGVALMFGKQPPPRVAAARNGE